MKKFLVSLLIIVSLFSVAAFSVGCDSPSDTEPNTDPGFEEEI